MADDLKRLIDQAVSEGRLNRIPAGVGAKYLGEQRFLNWTETFRE